MARRGIFWGLVWFCCCSIGLLAKEPKFQPVIPTDSIRFVSTLTDDRQVGSMLFDNFVLDTRIGKPSLPCVETKRFVHVLALESDSDSQLTYDVRGYVRTIGSGSAAILIHSLGESTLVNLDQAIKDAKSNTIVRREDLATKAAKLATAQGFTHCRPEKSDDFFVRIQRRVSAGTSAQTTILLLVDRLNTEQESGAMLAIDSVEHVVASEKKAGAK